MKSKSDDIFIRTKINNLNSAPAGVSWKKEASWNKIEQRIKAGQFPTSNYYKGKGGFIGGLLLLTILSGSIFYYYLLPDRSVSLPAKEAANVSKIVFPANSSQGILSAPADKNSSDNNKSYQGQYSKKKISPDTTIIIAVQQNVVIKDTVQITDSPYPKVLVGKRVPTPPYELEGDFRKNEALPKQFNPDNTIKRPSRDKKVRKRNLIGLSMDSIH